MQVSRHHSGGVAPLGDSRILACMQLPRNVSPVSASFIGPKRQGIHPSRCVACSFSLCVLSWFSTLLLNLLFLSKIEGISLCDCQSTKCQVTPTPGEWKTAACSLTRTLPVSTWKSMSRLVPVGQAGSSVLPRKEVIQPHLPVRLPCYDFTPITDPTLDAYLPQRG
jgi:hypothetical protein